MIFNVDLCRYQCPRARPAGHAVKRVKGPSRRLIPDRRATIAWNVGPFRSLLSSFAPRKPRIFRRAKGDNGVVISGTVLGTLARQHRLHCSAPAVKSPQKFQIFLAGFEYRIRMSPVDVFVFSLTRFRKGLALCCPGNDTSPKSSSPSSRSPH